MGVQQISSLTLLHLFASSGDSDIRTAVRLDTSLTLCLLFASGQRGVGVGWCIRTAARQDTSLTLCLLFASEQRGMGGGWCIRTATRQDTSLTLCLLFASGQRGVGGGWCIRTATGLFTDFTPPHYAFQSKGGTLREQQDTSLAS